MLCPYCNKEMVSGFLYGDRYRSTWLTEKEGLAFGLFATGGERIGRRGFFTPPKIKADRCLACRKIIIDLDEQEQE